MKPHSTSYTNPGFPFPFGASYLGENTWNFALTSFSASEVCLCLYNRESKSLIKEYELSPLSNKTGAVWHIVINDLTHPNETVYAFKISGTSSPLLDPYAKGVASGIEWGAIPTKFYAPYGELIKEKPSASTKPHLRIEDLIIYEMHVRGFTRDPSSRTSNPGTFLGLLEKIPHLLSLGINAVELMPIQEFDENEYKRFHPEVEKDLYNYWGYSTVNFFSPMGRYSTKNALGAAIDECKLMIQELHKNRIEVILDIVFNHTAEGGMTGPTFSFKGLDKTLYYMTEKGEYLNFTGCGNTINGNQTIVSELILTCLRYWVVEMDVDGFRFDLASIFSRDRQGHPQAITALIKAITDDPILATVKLIAEPWDAAGLYQVGSFAAKSPRWSEWNDKYRDCIRRFIKGMPGTNGDFARRISGSEDLYHGRFPSASINFVTAHDGFTLADLVAYNTKHNQENGENNKDGSNHNESWNCGAEGPTNDPKVQKIRQQQMRNFHLALMISQGTPLLLMGDEYGHTKKGNNNTWCQDNALNWFQWDQLAELPYDNFPRFYRALIHFRSTRSILRRNSFLTDLDIDWHGVIPFKADWKGEHAFLAFTLKDHSGGQDLYLAFNAQDKSVGVTLPASKKGWKWIVNTANPSPCDFYEDGPVNGDDTLEMPPYSAVMLSLV